MASTRNINTPGDYAAAQSAMKKESNYCVYEGYGVPSEVCFPGNRILTGRMASEVLSKNSIDIESSLFGINSTNLVIPQPEVKPEINTLPSLNMVTTKKVIVMEPKPANVTHKPLYLN